MKPFLLPHLICPVCLPKEHPLDLAAGREVEGDILTGTLACRNCRSSFPIKDGVAILLADPQGGPSGGQWRYEEGGMQDRYLWSHYADLLQDPDCGEANAQWAECLAQKAESGFDAGCSVGRLAFEMALRSDWAVGCDLSHSSIRVARRLAMERQLTFSLPLEGKLREEFHLKLPDDWRTDRLEFVVADALRLPFARKSFQQCASLNLLDRVRYPLAHLFEMNRVACDRDATFLFADPFSWDISAAPEELWLGGTLTGPYRGRGLDNVRAVLEGRAKVVTPSWRIARSGAISWRMRSHCNHFELIRSHFLVAKR